MILASDFERARRAEPWATTRVGRALRIVLLLATAAMGTYLMKVSIPRIQPALAEGLFQVLKPGVVCWIIGGVGAFAMGLAARTIVPRSSRGGSSLAALAVEAIPIRVDGRFASISTETPASVDADAAGHPAEHRLGNRRRRAGAGPGVEPATLSSRASP